jgi:hypothetical protein
MIIFLHGPWEIKAEVESFSNAATKSSTQILGDEMKGIFS